MSKDLPDFRKAPRSYAAKFVNSALSGPRGAALIRLIEFDDGHFRAIFDAAYFELQAGNAAPSKSQWNTLKKKLKRRNRSIFVFRAHGELPCPGATRANKGRKCLYLDFGFLRD